MGEKFGSKSMDDNGDGLGVYSDVQVESEGTPGYNGCLRGEGRLEFYSSFPERNWRLFQSPQCVEGQTSC